MALFYKCEKCGKLTVSDPDDSVHAYERHLREDHRIGKVTASLMRHRQLERRFGKSNERG